MYTAYEIPDTAFKQISSVFPPKFPDVFGHHVTVDFGVPADHSIPEQAEIKLTCHIVSMFTDIECFVVSVNGNSTRSDGGIYHLTWSLDRSYASPVDSNKMIYMVYNTTSHDYTTRYINHKHLKHKHMNFGVIPVIEPFIAQGKMYK